MIKMPEPTCWGRYNEYLLDEGQKVWASWAGYQHHQHSEPLYTEEQMQEIYRQAFEAGLRVNQLPINKRETPEQQDARIEQLRQNPNRRTPQIDE